MIECLPPIAWSPFAARSVYDLVLAIWLISEVFRPFILSTNAKN